MNINQRKTSSTQPAPQTRNQPGQQHNIGIDFWHAVEFSSVGHAPSPSANSDPGLIVVVVEQPATPSGAALLRWLRDRLSTLAGSAPCSNSPLGSRPAPVC